MKAVDGGFVWLVWSLEVCAIIESSFAVEGVVSIGFKFGL